MESGLMKSIIMEGYAWAVILSVCVPAITGHVDIVSPVTEYVQVTSGDTVSIECESVWGHQITWLHNGVHIHTHNHRFTVTSIQDDRSGVRRSVLTIQNTQERDSGLFTCRDEHDQSDEIVVYISDHTHIPKVDIVEPDTDEVSVSPGRSFMLKCVNQQGNDLKWYHNGLLLTSSTKVIITTALRLDGTMATLMTCRDVKPADAGVYMCKDEEDVNNSDRVHVVVEESHHGIAQIDIVEPALSHITLKEGTPLHLKCTAAQNTHIGWLKDGSQIDSGQDGYVVTESVDGTYRTSLLSRDQTVVEEAVYTCYNLDDHSEKDDVKVDYGGSDRDNYDLPTHMDFVLITMQTSVSLQCRIDADGVYTVVWTRHGLVVTPGEKYIISTKTTPSTLTIRNTDINDIGQYTCTFVESESKKPAGMVIYNVSGTPCPPLEIPNNDTPLDCPKNAFVGDTCTIQCDVTSNTVGSNVVMCDRDPLTGHAYWSNTDAQCTVPLTPVSERENIPSSLSHVLLRAREDLRLQCGQRGVWTRGHGVRIVTGLKYHIINTTLVIKNTGKSDVGVYTCTIHDNKGVIFGKKNFNVTSMPCSPLRVPDNGQINGCSPRHAVYGHVCSFMCDEGFEMFGSPTTSCELLRSQTQTYWTSDTPVCTSNGLHNQFYDTNTNSADTAFSSLYTNTVITTSLLLNACLMTLFCIRQPKS